MEKGELKVSQSQLVRIAPPQRKRQANNSRKERKEGGGAPIKEDVPVSRELA